LAESGAGAGLGGEPSAGGGATASGRPEGLAADLDGFLVEGERGQVAVGAFGGAADGEFGFAALGAGQFVDVLGGESGGTAVHEGATVLPLGLVAALEFVGWDAELARGFIEGVGLGHGATRLPPAATG